MPIPCEQTAGQVHSTETDNKPFESIAKLNNPNETKLRSYRN